MLQAVILTALAVVMMFAGLALAGVAGLAVGQGSGSVAVEASAMAMGQLFGFGGAAAAAVLWLRHGISWQEFLSVWPVRPRTVAFAVIAGAAYQFPLAEISNAAQEWWPVPLAKQELMARLLSPGSVVELLAVVAAIVLVAPLTEEVLFRGVLLGGSIAATAPSSRSPFRRPCSASATSSHRPSCTPPRPGYSSVGSAFGWVPSPSPS